MTSLVVAIVIVIVLLALFMVGRKREGMAQIYYGSWFDQFPSVNFIDVDQSYLDPQTGNYYVLIRGTSSGTRKNYIIYSPINGSYVWPATKYADDPPDVVSWVQQNYLPNIYYARMEPGISISTLRQRLLVGPTSIQPTTLPSAPGYMFRHGSILSYGGDLYMLTIINNNNSVIMQKLSPEMKTQFYGRFRIVDYAIPLSPDDFAALQPRIGETYVFSQMPEWQRLLVMNRYAQRDLPANIVKSVTVDNELQCSGIALADTTSRQRNLGYTYDTTTRRCDIKTGTYSPGVSLGFRTRDGYWKVYMNTDLPNLGVVYSEPATSHQTCQQLLAQYNGDVYSFNGSTCTVRRLPADADLMSGLSTYSDTPNPTSVATTLTPGKCYYGAKSAFPGYIRVVDKNTICTVPSTEYTTRCGGTSTAVSPSSIFPNNSYQNVPTCGNPYDLGYPVDFDSMIVPML